MTADRSRLNLVEWWAQRLRRAQREDGFTLIELLVVIVILAILAAVVVFAVQGVGDKGEAAAKAIDARTLRTAEEAYFARNGRYGTEAELVAGGFLSEESSSHKVYLNNGAGSCAAGSKCEYSLGNQDEAVTIRAYIGRTGSLVNPVISQFQADTGITVETVGAGAGDTSTTLATQIITAGAGTDADVFFSQDAGNLGRVSRAGLFKTVPVGANDSAFQARDNTWAGVSARARVIVYKPGTSPPTNVDALTSATWNGKVAYVPTNASFQNFVAAMILLRGTDTPINPALRTARQWLIDFKNNNPVVMGSNRAVVEAVANNTGTGPTLGLVNHYYRFQGSSGSPTFNSADAVNSHPISTADNRDAGSLVNSAGVGILKRTDNPGAAEMFVKYLLSSAAQTHFANTTKEYPLGGGVSPDPSLVPLDQIQSPNRVHNLNLNDLDNAAAVTLLEQTGHLTPTPIP